MVLATPKYLLDLISLLTAALVLSNLFGNSATSAAPYNVAAAQKGSKASSSQGTRVSRPKDGQRFPNCPYLDGFCADAHPIMFGDPVPEFFTCKSNSDCNDHQCNKQTGKCDCKGGNMFKNCGVMIMYHREWEVMKNIPERPEFRKGERIVPHPMTYLQKGDYLRISQEDVLSHPSLQVASNEVISIPSDEVFLNMNRGDNVMQRLATLTNEWSLIQDIAGKRDNATAPKIFKEISFMVSGILESDYAKKNKFDLTALLWRQLSTINTALTWGIKNCLRFNSHNQVKRLGLQEYGQGYFFKVFELLLSATLHPNGMANLEMSGEQFINRDQTMMQRVTKLMFHELMFLLIDAGVSTHGALPIAAQNMDVKAIRILIDYGNVDPTADDQRDEFGRSALQLAAQNRRFAYDNVYEYLCEKVPNSPECKPETKNLDVCAFEERCDIKSSKERDTVYLHNVGASISLNCPMLEFNGDELNTDMFREDILGVGASAIFNNLTNDWPMVKDWTFESLKNKYGDVEVSVGRIPYGYRFGREYHKEPLREYISYLESMNDAESPITDTPQYIFDAEILEEDIFLNKSFRIENYPSGETRHPDGSYLPNFLHPHRFTWMGDGILNDLYGTVLGDGSNRAHQWFLGPKESGAPLHHHCQAFNTMIQGRKMWLIFPPSHPQMGVGYSNMEAVVWLRRTAILNPSILTNPEKYGMMVCVQEAGQTIFIPTHWTHATINIEPALGFAAECFANC